MIYDLNLTIFGIGILLLLPICISIIQKVWYELTHNDNSTLAEKYGVTLLLCSYIGLAIMYISQK